MRLGCPQGVPPRPGPRPGSLSRAAEAATRHSARHSRLMALALLTFLPGAVSGKRPELTEKTQFPPGNLLCRQRRVATSARQDRGDMCKREQWKCC